MFLNINKVQGFLCVRLCTLIITGLFLSACTSVQFNQKFENVAWKKVIVAPFIGDGAKQAETLFNHAFATESRFTLVTSNVVAVKLNKAGKSEAFAQDPYSTMLEMAKAEKAEAFIIAETMVGHSSSGVGGSAGFASLSMSLYDTESGLVIGSTLQEDSSVLSGPASVMNSTTHAAIAEFEEIFELAVDDRN